MARGEDARCGGRLTTPPCPPLHKWRWGNRHLPVADVRIIASGNVTSPPACRPPPFHKWRGGGRRPRCGRNVFGEGEDARVAGVYGFGEGDGHLPTADVRYLARGTFGMVGLGRLGSPALHDTIAR